MFKKVMAVMLMGISLTGCYKDNEEELYPNNNLVDNNTYYYAADIKPLMNAKCATSGCHLAGAQAPDLSNYTSLKANIGRVEVRAITEKTMPTSGALSITEINKLKNWIAAGALNN